MVVNCEAQSLSWRQPQVTLLKSKAEAMEKVTITRAEYNKLLAMRERLAELQGRTEGAHAIEAYSKDPSSFLPADMAKRLIAGESPVRIWRERRGLKGNELARAAGITAAYLSEIEAKKKPGSIKVLRKLSRALGVMVDDLLPS
jgi:DNA-binding Xre family transcriptional regulator